MRRASGIGIAQRTGEVAGKRQLQQAMAGMLGMAGAEAAVVGTALVRSGLGAFRIGRRLDHMPLVKGAEAWHRIPCRPDQRRKATVLGAGARQVDGAIPVFVIRSLEPAQADRTQALGRMQALHAGLLAQMGVHVETVAFNELAYLLPAFSHDLSEDLVVKKSEMMIEEKNQEE